MGLFCHFDEGEITRRELLMRFTTSVQYDRVSFVEMKIISLVQVMESHIVFYDHLLPLLKK